MIKNKKQIQKNKNLDFKLQAYKELSQALKKRLQTAKTVLPIGAAFLIGVPVVEAAIIYSGIQSLQVGPGFGSMGDISVDINGGGNDLEFQVDNIGANPSFKVLLLNAGDVTAFQGDSTAPGGYGYPYAKMINESINNANQIAGNTIGGTQNGFNTLADAAYAGNHWSGLSNGDERFMGFRLTGNLFGWIRIRATNNVNTWILIDWAYDDQANTPITPATTLPVELQYFKATKSNLSAHLTWKTVSELNNAGFEIERSEDGENFRTIAWVEGAGTTVESQEYFYDDKALRKGQTYYYRLKQMDYDGKVEYFQVVSLTFEGDTKQIGEIYPNPSADGWVQIDYTMEKAGNVNVTVYSQDGREMVVIQKTLDKGNQLLSLDLSMLDNGIYFLKFNEDNKRYYRKAVIQK